MLLTKQLRPSFECKAFGAVELLRLDHFIVVGQRSSLYYVMVAMENISRDLLRPQLKEELKEDRHVSR